MGMFDTIKLNVVCPSCGEESFMKVQTKELDCELRVFEKGDFVSKKYRYIEGTANCISQTCQDKTIKERGYFGGFGFLFRIKIRLKKGFVNGKYKIIEG